jgi:single-strand DNA-binding protein
MKNLNCITLTGRLGRDFEVRNTQSGTAVAENSLAVASGYGDKESTIWVPLTFWGKSAESAAQYLGKGRECIIKGRLDQDEWTDKNTGEKKTKMKVTVEDWGFIGPKPDGQPAQAPTTSQPRQTASQQMQDARTVAHYDAGGSDDDTPF